MNDSIVHAVKVIKAAILESQAQVLRSANGSMLSLYYGIGRFVSANSRTGTWGTGAIAAISERLQREMPGLRGFGERNIKNMRSFYEFWSPLIDRQPTAAEFKSAYLGQLHLYLQILEDQYKQPHENPPIGIILCKSADKAFVEYAVRDFDKPMGVATYRTSDEMPKRLRDALPPIDELKKQLGGTP